MSRMGFTEGDKGGSSKGQGRFCGSNPDKMKIMTAAKEGVGMSQSQYVKEEGKRASRAP